MWGGRASKGGLEGEPRAPGQGLNLCEAECFLVLLSKWMNELTYVRMYIHRSGQISPFLVCGGKYSHLSYSHLCYRWSSTAANLSPPPIKNSLDLLQSQEHPVAKPLSVLCLCSILGLVFVIMHRQEVGYDFAFVRAQDDSKSCWRILRKFFERLECVTSGSWLDIGGVADHDADAGIFKSDFYRCDTRAMLNCGYSSVALGRFPVSECFYSSWRIWRSHFIVSSRLLCIY